MAHDKSPLEYAADLVLFGPLGLALATKDALPEWVELGRRRVGHQVEGARFVGELVTGYGRQRVTATLVGLGILPGAPPPTPAATRAPACAPGSEVAPGVMVADGAVPNGSVPNGISLDVPVAVTVAVPVPIAVPVEVPFVVSESVPGSAELAIPGYDSLSASQVVQRLAGLAPGELEAVRRYEAAGRGRRTILTKVSQLQVGRP